MTSRIERIEEMRLTRDDERQIAALLYQSFQTDFGGRSYYKQRHHLRLIWREEGRIVGHMALTIRDIRLGARLLTIMGLAEVSTDPDLRGRGIASALMKASIDEARASLASFYLLFGNQPLYHASGFVAQPNMLLHVGMDGARTGALETSSSDGLMVMPLADLDWDPLAEVDLMGHLF